MAQSGTVNSSLTFRLRPRDWAWRRWCACDGKRPQTRQVWLATNRRCSLQRIRFGSEMVSTLLSIFGREEEGSSSASLPSEALPYAGSAKAMAHCFRWLTNRGAIPDFGDGSCFRLLFSARTVSTFISQIANRSSMSLASVIASRSARTNSLGLSKLASPALDVERKIHGPIGFDALSILPLRTPTWSRS